MSTPTLPKTFSYEALDAQGKRTKGKIEASTDSAAAATLRQQGVTPLSLTEAGKGLQKELQIPGLSGRVTLK
ncbi:MAG: type II secretion system F family protein, partial [Actinobacteria bacterium]|nr:type II secretion system F family protein [Actinomycetota bacterium]